MPRPTRRVKTLGSVWLFDEVDLVYLRMPRQEQKRASPPGKDWGGPSAGACQDLVWHPYVSFSITERDRHFDIEHADGSVSEHVGRSLYIVVPPAKEAERNRIVHAPCAEEEFTA